MDNTDTVDIYVYIHIYVSVYVEKISSYMFNVTLAIGLYVTLNIYEEIFRTYMDSGEAGVLRT